MAITEAAMTAELGTNGTSPRIVRYEGVVATFQEWYVQGEVGYPGQCRWVRTTAADSAATQAAAVVTALTR